MADPFDLTGRTAVVSGGSRGIGAAIVELFAAHGARVGYCYAPGDEDADSVAERLTDRGHRVVARSCDVSDESDVGLLARWAETELGDVDIAVTCAGVGSPDRRLDEIDPAEWDRVIGVNLRGTYLVARAFYGSMRRRGRGRIITVASQLAHKGHPGLAHYCASKAGVVGLTRALALEAAPHGVLVNAIAPGPVDTVLLRGSRDPLTDKRAAVPLGRVGDTAEIAPTALLLASEAGSFYVGQTLSPNGGDVLL